MVNLDILFALIFYGIILFLFFKYREKFEVQSKIFVMYKTTWGLKLMDRIAKKFPNALHLISYISITIGFIGMAAIVTFLIFGTAKLITVPESQPVLSPVLPGVKIPGLPVLSFWHWIISILLVAVIHESFHGIYARLNNIKVKSSGFAFLGPILAAFVEPDAKQLERSSKHAQLSVLSAGAFSNIVMGIVIIAVGYLLIAPMTASIVEAKGVQIIEISNNLPINSTNLKPGDTIDKINDKIIGDVKDFVDIMKNFKPNDVIKVTSNNTIYNIKLGSNEEDPTKALLGVSVTHHSVDIKENIKEKYGKFLPKALLWFSELIFWLYAISIGVGLFNLLPLGPVDGGKMFYLGVLYLIKDKNKSMKIYNFTSLFILFLIFINLLPFIVKLLTFLFNGIILLLF